MVEQGRIGTPIGRKIVAGNDENMNAHT